jgi:ABC-type multidrug transport system fused ATPase/permease subunit
LAQVHDASCIAVVYNGVVLESGSHEQLMGKGPGGSYAKLVQAQNQGNKGADDSSASG